MTAIVVLILIFVIDTKCEFIVCIMTASNVQVKIPININNSVNFQR